MITMKIFYLLLSYYFLCTAPGKVGSFMALVRGSGHFHLKWEPPEEKNGVLIGYNIGFQKSKFFLDIKITCKILSSNKIEFVIIKIFI